MTCLSPAITAVTAGVATILALAWAPAAWAASDDCAVSISQPLIDYGVLNRTTLKPLAGELPLGVRNLVLNVHCPRPQPITLFYRAAPASAERFRFGDQGSYALRVSGALVDGESVDLASLTKTGGVTEQADAVSDWLPDKGLAPIRAGNLVPVRSFSARLEIRAWGDESVFNRGDAVTWQANGLLDIAGVVRELGLQAGFAPAACTPRLGNGGIVDFGRIPAQQLARNSNTRFQRTLALSVQCDAPTRFAFTARDNRAEALRSPLTGFDPGALFGIGTTAAGQSLGSYTTWLADILGDATALAAMHGQPAGLGWQPVKGAALLLTDGRLLGFGTTDELVAGPKAITHLQGTLGVDLYLAPADTLTLTDEALIDGAATLEIIYL
ncbi:DUF1120 domain-containing protein [Pseudomonas sp. B21-032]|uniref:DUF1120 domain-containing protein n=1 Tax=Pseudomonas sp. B21-032 TaxID=2895483 RepID=UPI00215FB7D8|nr:DUF1120 domain-containing protein [Pseudomonas sp. B21-032]UVL64268.1 DUF1120 domain-containing protein [Pseudomonas sp. B21-032]